MRSLNVLFAVVLMSGMIHSIASAQEISGVGVKLAEKNGQIVLDMVYPGTPAEEAGLKSGDAILAVNGKSTNGRTVLEIQKLMAGLSGTKVKMLVQNDKGNKRTIELTRKTMRSSAESPSDFIGEFVCKDKPEMKIVVKKANEQKYQIFCENENWSGAGLIYQNPSFKSFHFKGVFRLDDGPKVDSSMRGVGGFFRINYLVNGALELKRQWGLEGDKGDKATTVILMRSDAKKE